MTGTPEQPAKAGISIADIAGGMYAYSAILTALLRRATTGLATPVEVSLFESLAEWMGAPAYYTRYSGVQPERVVVAARFAILDGPSAVALLEQAKVAYAHLNSVDAFLHHPVLAGRDRWREVSTPHGDVRALLPPANLAGVVPRMDPVPAVGEHTDAILAELGYGRVEIATLRADGAI